MGKPESEMTAAQIKHKRAQVLAWRQKHRAYLVQYTKKWQAEHPEELRKYREKYFAKPGKRAAVNRRTAAYKRFKYKQAKLAVLRALGGKCSRCGYKKSVAAL